uniref:GNAT family N-acetyltransferase n=1 Tax=Nocardia brasiliensis TaxID=37326 RepID=UPI0024539E5B|nr:GNAT family N-acetyltransferase [Nocardia brasiliensis]
MAEVAVDPAARGQGIGAELVAAALAEVHPLLAVAVNVVAAGGAAPTAWRLREAPVTRWVVLGGVAGVGLGWLVLLLGGLAS